MGQDGDGSFWRRKDEAVESEWKWRFENMLEQVLEGTWEEIAQHADELAGKRVRLTVVEEAPAANEAALQVMEQVAQLQSGMRYTSGADTQQLLREARAGAMYGYDPCE
jgi:alkylation response protein AidB-like acyl-CoA dehydrogenase